MKNFKRLPKWVSAPNLRGQHWDRAVKEERGGTEENQRVEKCKGVLNFLC